MKRTIIAVISIVLIAFAFTACRQSVVIPYDPTPSNPNTPSGPSVPDDTIQVGDKTYKYLEDAIAEAAAGSTIEIGAGEYRVASAIPVSKDITIVGAGMDDKTIIKVNGNTAFNITGSSVTISNLKIQDTADPSARKLINVESSKIVIDSVRFEGLYTDGDIRYYGIVTNADVSDVTIKNSVFKGFKIPVLLDFDNVENPKATISGNTFDTFNKLSFSNYNDSIIISSDNEFVNPTNKEYQIELFKGDSLTAEQAVSVAKNTGLVVKAELEEGVYFNFDAEGAVISTVEQLKAFATGKLGKTARLAAPISLTSQIKFTEDNLSLIGNEDAAISVTTGAENEVIVLEGSSITLNSIHFEAAGSNRIDFVIVRGDNATIDDCVFTGADAAKEGTWVIYGITSYADNTKVVNNTFEKLRVPFYFYEARSKNGSAINNIITDCFKLDLETGALVDNIYNNTVINTPVNILAIYGTVPADKASTLAKNNSTDVTLAGVVYNADGKAVISSADAIAKVFAASTTTDEPLEAVITESFTVDSAVSVGGSGLTITAEEGIEPITLKAVITIDNASDITFSGVDFNVEGIETAAIHVNNTNTSDIAFYDCVFERSAKGAGALSIGHMAKNITIEKCTFDNFITAIYMNGTSGRIVDNTISTYGGIYLAGVTAPYAYSDLTVEGNIADYNDVYNPAATDGSAWDNTLRIAVTDLSDEAIGYANTLYRDNEDMNVAVITETGPAVLWANGETITQ